MNAQPKTGVFLCKCGNRIEPFVDLGHLLNHVTADSGVAHCEILPYPCTRPGWEHMMQTVAGKKLNRMVIAGCESRLMAKTFSRVFEPLGFHKEQIDMVNLRDHVAAVSAMSPKDNAAKGAKLIGAAVAEMAVLAPTIQTLARIEGPVLIVGEGIASFAAAKELHDHQYEFILAASDIDPRKILNALHHTYPGERSYYHKLEHMIEEVTTSRYGTFLTDHKLTLLSGVTGDYSLTFQHRDHASARQVHAGAVIVCIDARLSPPGLEFGYDGERVMTPSEMENRIQTQGAPQGNIVFWINDYELGTPEMAQLSARTAWAIARHIRGCAPASRAILLYNRQMAVPLNAAERAINRKAGIVWIPYDPAMRPSIQDGFITFCNLSDHVEHEIQWDWCVLSPQRELAGKGRRIAEILGLACRNDRFLGGHHTRVRPEMVGREETYLAGSARYPCDLHETLSQGRRAAKKTLQMLEKSKAGQLYIPRMVCMVDPEKCIGCGQCQELCDCGGIGVVEGRGGGLPRVVDPMVCTGGGTCAAACPYHALVLQNNTNAQREARIAALAAKMGPGQVIAYACMWGGLPAADNAGKKGLAYDSRIHILAIPCVGQLDPCVMARAFLEGAPGLLLIGCSPEQCHHSFGLDHAWSRINAIKKLLTLCGFERSRIALAHADLNRPEEFVRTVDSFTQRLAALGPIEPTPENRRKLNAMYDCIKNNTRVRHLISASLRRPWEDRYRGEPIHALAYDQDFSHVIAEEFMQHRLRYLLRDGKRSYRLDELVSGMEEKEQQVVACLWEMINEGTVAYDYKDRMPLYRLHSEAKKPFKI